VPAPAGAGSRWWRQAGSGNSSSGTGNEDGDKKDKPAEPEKH
jgi:hypothetical protein